MACNDTPFGPPCVPSVICVGGRIIVRYCPSSDAICAPPTPSPVPPPTPAPPAGPCPQVITGGRGGTTITIPCPPGQDAPRPTDVFHTVPNKPADDMTIFQRSPYNSAPTCPQGTTPFSLISPGTGLVITGCNAIPTTNPDNNGGGDIDFPKGCDPPKVLGFGLKDPTDPTSIEYKGCSCAEASVNLADVAITVGTGVYAVWRAAALAAAKAAKSAAEDAIKKAISYGEYVEEMLEAFWKEKYETEEIIRNLEELIRRGDNGFTGDGFYAANMDGFVWPQELIDKFRKENGFFWVGGQYIGEMGHRSRIDALKDGIDNLMSGEGGVFGQWPSLDDCYKRAAGTPCGNMNYWKVQKERNTANLDAARKNLDDSNKLIDAIMYAFDPTALATALTAGSIPISFVVPKECGWPQVLDENCNCVNPPNPPIVSGSYTSWTNVDANILSQYDVIETL